MNTLKNTLLTLIAPLLWGSTYMITALFIPINRPIFVALMRGLPIGLILLLYYRKWPQKQWLLKTFILGTLNIGGFFLFLFIAAYRLPGGIAAVLGSVQPLFVILLSWLILKERPQKRSVLAALMVITGVTLLISTPSIELDSIGILAAFLGALTMALGVVLTKYWGKPKEVSPMNFTAWQLFFGSLILIPLTFFIENDLPLLTFNNWIGLVILGIFNTGIAYFLWFRGIEKLSPTKVTLLSPINPIVAFILGYIVFHQTVNPLQLIGVSIIIVSLIFSQKRQ